MKIFISQPMAGRTEEEILTERNLAIEDLKNLFGDKVEILHSYRNDPKPPLYLLGTAIQKMAYADMVCFIDGWRESRGCMIEYECAVMYDLDCYELSYKEDDYEN